ncbi:hypothetical protein [Paenibacillus sp. 1P03SA]|uniref:hypothetical protein n=1 Tax=Paenibacillus sp. 1P03SA TaxID=3132294 RepID=UPI0039A17FB3
MFRDRWRMAGIGAFPAGGGLLSRSRSHQAAITIRRFPRRRRRRNALFPREGSLTMALFPQAKRQTSEADETPSGDWLRDGG